MGGGQVRWVLGCRWVVSWVVLQLGERWWMEVWGSEFGKLSELWAKVLVLRWLEDWEMVRWGEWWVELRGVKWSSTVHRCTHCNYIHVYLETRKEGVNSEDVPSVPSDMVLSHHAVFLHGRLLFRSLQKPIIAAGLLKKKHLLVCLEGSMWIRIHRTMLQHFLQYRSWIHDTDPGSGSRTSASG